MMEKEISNVTGNRSLAERRQIELKAQASFDRSVTFLRLQGVQVPDDVRYKVSSEKNLVLAAASLTSNDYEVAWASLVASELQLRYGLDVSPDDLQSTMDRSVEEITVSDFDSADILLSPNILWPHVYDNEVMHELWHVAVYKGNLTGATPLLVEAEAVYVAGQYSPVCGFEHPEGSLEWWKYDGPASIVTNTMEREGREIFNLFSDKDLRRRLNLEIEKFYRDQARTPGYVMIPYVIELLGVHDYEREDLFTRAGLIKAYEDIGQPHIARAVLNLESDTALIKDLRIAYETAFY